MICLKVYLIVTHLIENEKGKILVKIFLKYRDGFKIFLMKK